MAAPTPAPVKHLVAAPAPAAPAPSGLAQVTIDSARQQLIGLRIAKTKFAKPFQRIVESSGDFADEVGQAVGISQRLGNDREFELR